MKLIVPPVQHAVSAASRRLERAYPGRPRAFQRCGLSLVRASGPPTEAPTEGAPARVLREAVRPGA
eukprot:270495-Prymnesium_polylepis.1